MPKSKRKGKSILKFLGRKNKKMRDTNAKKNYDDKGEVGIAVRDHLETIQLKSFHNWIKSVLITKTKEFIEEVIRAKFVKVSVFDIACGKGGDLLKWKKLKIVNYIGADISSSAVIDAHKRWIKFYRPFTARFIECDATVS